MDTKKDIDKAVVKPDEKSGLTRRKLIRNGLVGGTALGIATGFPEFFVKNSGNAYAADGKIKVGVLFSLTGGTAIVEDSLNKATLMAIDEVNAAGGINGAMLDPIIEDPASDPATFAEKARKLVVSDEVACVFGSYTSASRKAVLPIFERRNNLYWYPTLYEGRECSKNVIYTGAVPNQQQDNYVEWLIKTYGPRFYLVGSNYIYPKEENNYCKKLLERLGGEVVGEEYVPLGHSEFSSVLGKIKDAKPNVIFSTVVGDSVIALHRQYREAGLNPDNMPMASLTTSEIEVAAMGGDAAAGHLTSAPYFMSSSSDENEKFIQNYWERYGSDSVTHFVSEAAYFQVHLMKQAAEKIGSLSDITPNNLRDAAKGQSFMAPQGLVSIEGENLHTHLSQKRAMANSQGQFDVIWESPETIKPEPYAAYSDKVCTATGLKSV